MAPIDTDARDPETHVIIGAAMAVHSALGAGFLEAVYQAAIAVEFSNQNISFRREAPLSILYRGKPLALSYRVDFLCFETIIVELKAQTCLTRQDNAQVINYLKASSLHKALLFHFGAPRLEYKRFVL